MQFNDTTNNLGIIQDIEQTLFGRFGAITGNTELFQQFVARSNRACDEITSLILEADYRWQFDDSNSTDLPIGTTALVADQQDYSFDTSHIRVTRVELKNENGDWVELTPIDQTDIYDTSLTDFLKTSGIPRYYDKLGTSVFLYPKPSYSQAASLKVYFQRQHAYFSISDTTKTPGFPVIYHRLIPLMASYDHAMVNSLDIRDALAVEVVKMKEALQDFIAGRSRDEHITLKVRQGNFK